jgi:hypothetical protein
MVVAIPLLSCCFDLLSALYKERSLWATRLFSSQENFQSVVDNDLQRFHNQGLMVLIQTF